VNERNDKQDGPYRVADVVTIWKRIARMIDFFAGLKGPGLGDVVISSPAIRAHLAYLEQREVSDVDHPTINLALAALAAPDDMTASDWLRMKVVDARGRTNVSLHPLDLRGLKCRRLVVRCDLEREYYRVTVQNQRSDFASAEGETLAAALDGAVRMIGARKDMP
jgi:hypothetical protein